MPEALAFPEEAETAAEIASMRVAQLYAEGVLEWSCSKYVCDVIHLRIRQIISALGGSLECPMHFAARTHRATNAARLRNERSDG